MTQILKARYHHYFLDLYLIFESIWLQIHSQFFVFEHQCDE